MTTTPAKGRCRECGRPFVILRDGTLRYHRLPRPTDRYTSYAMADCPGAGQPPASADTLPDTTDNRPDTSADSSDVRVGQIWQDCDKRGYGRRLRIEAVDATHADCREVTIAPQGAVVLVSGPRVRTRIRLDRFRPTSTGYRLVQDTTPDT